MDLGLNLGVQDRTLILLAINVSFGVAHEEIKNAAILCSCMKNGIPISFIWDTNPLPPLPTPELLADDGTSLIKIISIRVKIIDVTCFLKCLL